MAVAYNSSKIVTDGLVFALDAANIQSYPGSGITWTETTRTGITATTFNSPTYSSARGGYFSFDGINDYCVLSSSPNIAGESATFCVWNYGISAKTSSIIWLSSPAGARQFSVLLPWSDSVIYFDGGNYNSAPESFDRISKAVTDAEYKGWHHWTFIKNSTAGTMSIYRDGNLWHSGSGLYMPIGQAEYRFLGSTASGHYHNGYISNLQFYNRALSQAEIQQNYNAHRSRFITPTIVTDGLVLHLDAGDRQSYPGSGTTWTNLIGNGMNGTLTNGPTFSSTNWGSIVLDGSNDYIDVTQSIGSLVNNISLEIWYKDLADQQILGYGTTTTTGRNFMLGRNVTSGSAWKVTKYGLVDIIIGTVPRDNNWHQVVLTYSSQLGEGTRVYVDGVLNGSSPNETRNLATSISKFYFGYVPDGWAIGPTYLTGNIANVKLYNRPISAAEVAQNFNAIRERFGV